MSALRRALVLVSALAALVVAPAADAAPGLLVGVGDDALKWADHPAALRSSLDELGVGAIRFTQGWQPGQTRFSAADAHALDRAVAQARGLRIVLSVYGEAGAAPQDAAARAQYCGYVRSILARYPQIRDVAIWNEVNSSMFWSPQYAADDSSLAPAAYEALLSDCYGQLHAARPGLNVIVSLAPRGNDDPRAPGTVKHAAATFVRKLGETYRASGRQVKIFDTIGQNAYPRNSAERPWREHLEGGDVSQGDYPRLIEALHEAFGGTGQPLPGEGGVSVWYLENGFQTHVDPNKAGLYRGHENDAAALPSLAQGGDARFPAADSLAPDQATQLADSLRLAYCQPGVGAYFNFMLADEPELGGWQSGLLWADWTRKPSFAPFAAAVAEVQRGDVDCAALKGGTAGGADATATLAPCAYGTAPVVVEGGLSIRAAELAATRPAAVVARAVAEARCTLPAVAVDARATKSVPRSVWAAAGALARGGTRPFVVVRSARLLPARAMGTHLLVPAKPTAAAVRAAVRSLAAAGIAPERAGVLVAGPARPAVVRASRSLGLATVWFQGGTTR